MPPVSSWSTTAADNATALGIDIGEDCAAGNLNGSQREMMAQIKAWYDSITALVGSGSSGAQPLDATLTALAALTTSANKLIYATGSDTFATTDISSFGRALIDDADAATACNTLGAVRVAAMSLANPGYVKLQVGSSQYFMVAWGTCSIAANGTTSISYAAAFPTASFAVVNAGRQATGAQDNDAFVSACTTTGCTVYSASDTTNSGFYTAFGY